MSAASLSVVVGCVRRLVERDLDGLTDSELLDRFSLDRDEAAFAEVVRRHGTMVWSACWRVLRHDQDAEDVFQASFLVLARKAGSINQRGSVGGWLYRVAHRLAIRAGMAAERRQRQAMPLGEVPAPSACNVELRDELERLPETYRSAIVLCYLEGRTQIEAARMLATTPDAVNSRLKRARDLLRQRLSRDGPIVSVGALSAAFGAEGAQAALPRSIVEATTRTAARFIAGQVPTGASAARAIVLAKGALHTMSITKSKIILAMVAFTLTLLAVATQFGAPAALGENAPGLDTGLPAVVTAAVPAPDNAAPRPACIILWMSGGPSQFETFDPKPLNANGALFPAIDTSVKGIAISATLPKLAKQMDQLAIIRSVTHREGSHERAAYLMHVGRPVGGAVDYPSLGSVLAKELGAKATAVPRFVHIGARPDAGPGFLGPRFAPLIVLPGPLAAPLLPPASAFDPDEEAKGETKRQAIAPAFDLQREPPALRDAYGRTYLGQGCLLARRLVEAGVPVVEVQMGGWDTHDNVPGFLPRLAGDLDPAMATLIKDLRDRKRLDSTLVVWMGEFGRTPRINANQGRDHWPASFSVVLAGRNIRGGRVVGATTADGTAVAERPVTPPELIATIYQALGVDPAKTYRSPDDEDVPLVEPGRKAVKELLR